MKGLSLISWAAALVFILSSPLRGADAAKDAPNSSPGVAEVVRLADSGASEDAVLNYIKSAQMPFNLSADNILYLKNKGLSSAVITAMLNHDTPPKPEIPSVTPTPPTITPTPAPIEAPTTEISL